MLAAFIGGWELLLIGLALSVMAGVSLTILAIVVFVLRRRKRENGEQIRN
jgi:hypothetical protein